MDGLMNGWMDEKEGQEWMDGWINKPLDGQMVSLIMRIQNI